MIFLFLMILNHELTRINTNWADGLPSVASHSNEYSLSQIHQKFIAEPRTPNSEPRKYNLLPYIIQKSEKISVISCQSTVHSPQDSVSHPLSDEDYFIDYTNGVLYLNIPVHPSDTILCVYERLPFDLPIEYYHRKLAGETVYSQQPTVELHADLS